MIYIASFTISKLLHMNNTSLMPQMVKNLPAMRKTQLWSLGWEDSSGEQNGNPLQYSCLESSMGSRRVEWTQWLTLSLLKENRAKQIKGNNPPPFFFVRNLYQNIGGEGWGMQRKKFWVYIVKALTCFQDKWIEGVTYLETHLKVLDVKSKERTLNTSKQEK